jgi:putative tricarboxylic transport membrane protein
MQKNMRSKPDGSTIMLTGVSQIVGMLDGQLPNDFGEATWITTLIANVNALCVKADSPYKTADEFFAAVKKSKPGEFIFGSTGVRAQSEGMLWETVEALGPKDFVTGIMFDGGARCVTELIGGHISAALLKFNDVIGQFQAGEIRPLCVFTEQRIPLYSGLPTVFEFDWWGNQISYGGSDFMGLYLTGPKGLPEDIVGYYAAVMKDVLTSDEFREATKPWVCLIDPVLSGKEFMAVLERTRDNCKGMIEKYFK